MKVIGGIIRWIFGLLFALILFVSAVIIIPFSVLGQQLLQRENGMRLVNSVVEDNTVMEGFTEGFVSGAIESLSAQPEFYSLFSVAADKDSEAGIAFRKLLDSEVMAENVQVNAVNFYDWLDGKADSMVVVFNFSGTDADWENFTMMWAKNTLDELPECTAEEQKMYLSNPDSAPECIPADMTEEQKTAAATTMSESILNDVDVRSIMRDGITYPLTGSESLDRESLNIMYQISKAGLMGAWVVIVISILLMLVLFTPKGVNSIMTGLITGMIGLTLISFGGGFLTMIAQESTSVGVSGVESVASAFAEVLGAPIARQGMYMVGIALLLIVLGIFRLVKKKTKVVVKEVVREVEVESPERQNMDNNSANSESNTNPTNSSEEDTSKKEDQSL